MIDRPTPTSHFLPASPRHTPLTAHENPPVGPHAPSGFVVPGRLGALAVLITSAALATPFVSAENWPAWRGPNADGSTRETRFPLHWSPTQNIRWRVDLPDRGNSTPIVWGDVIVLTQAIEKDHRRLISAYHRRDGHLLWQTGINAEPKEETHEDNPYAAASPVTDGKHVVATFGAAGVLATDLQGRELWRVPLGPQVHEWGYSSSPVIEGNRAYVYHGPGPHSRLVAIQLDTGKIAWNVPLQEPVPTTRTDGFKGRAPGVVGSFSTPLVVQRNDRTEVVFAFPEQLRSFDPTSGRELWHAGGLNPLVYATPLNLGDSIFISGGFFGSSIAIRPGGSGDITASHTLWREERSKKNRLGSAVAKDDTLFLVNMDGFLECLDRKTGKQLWEERLDGPGAADASWSSLTLAGDRLYTVNRSGDSFVIRASRKFEILATNTVSELSHSSFAMSDGDLFLRTWKSLWCISDKGRLAAR